MTAAETSNVIKGRALRESLAQPAVITRQAQAAYLSAHEIAAAARLEAERILHQARQEARELAEAARRDGYRAGAAEWAGALAALHTTRDEYLAQNELALLRLSVRIAEKLLGEELRSAPETVALIVREALRAARRAQAFTVQAHPEDAAILREHLATLRSAAGQSCSIEIVSNASLARGGCLLESDVSKIDARIQTQLSNLERTLTAKAPS